MLVFVYVVCCLLLVLVAVFVTAAAGGFVELVYDLTQGTSIQRISTNDNSRLLLLSVEVNLDLYTFESPKQLV